MLKFRETKVAQKQFYGTKKNKKKIGMLMLTI